jgi:DNA-binding LacI/PurR family transcriptional regulator
MPSVNIPSFLTIADQVAEHLRAEILRGRWSGSMPGKHQLAAELGVNNKTVEAALRQLEKAGLLLPQGAGRSRRINPRRRKSSRALRIALLLNELPHDAKSELHLEITHALTDAGHASSIAPRSLDALRFEPKRVARLVRETTADAWVIYGGSRDVLEWFASQPLPAFALSGHRIGVKIPAVSPHKPPAVAAAARHLIEFGHRRIVLLCRKIRRLPRPGLSETVFLETLRAQDCPVGDYNLPDWEETNEGFQECLRALFRVTPPTALIVDEAAYVVAAMQFFLSRGIRVPRDVSLVSTDDDPAFAHCHPPIACITWDIRPVVRRILQWADHVSRGKPDLRQTLTPAKFVPGGTVAAPSR